MTRLHSLVLARRIAPVFLLALLVLAASLACSSQSPNIGRYYKGRILHVSVADLQRTDELRWTTAARFTSRTSERTQGSCIGIAWSTSDGETCIGIRRQPSDEAILQDVTEELSNVLQNTQEGFYRLTPQSPENELILLRVRVENHTATSAIVNVDRDSAQLRDFFQGKYAPIDVGALAQEAEVPEKPSDRCNVPVNPETPTECVRFLWNALDEEQQPDGQVNLVHRAQQLPRGTGLDGWLVFEVPRDTEFRSFRWGAGDTVIIDF